MSILAVPKLHSVLWGTDTETGTRERRETYHIRCGRVHPVTGPFNTVGGHETCSLHHKGRTVFKDTLAINIIKIIPVRRSPEGPTDPSLHPISAK